MWKSCHVPYQLTHREIGPLVRQETAVVYDRKVEDWLEWNELVGWDPLRCSDAKICAFAGWLFGRTVNKDLNSWTSAINGFFDSHCGVRPLNTHTITNLKKRYHDKQLRRTLQRLGPNALEPAEARIGVPPGRLQILLRDAVAAAANCGSVLEVGAVAGHHRVLHAAGHCVGFPAV
ncbi:hypothetical protein OAN61_01155 [bacterium]|nr:hypothetical protein [bacterium]